MYLLSFIDPRSTALDIILPLCVLSFGLGFGMAQRTNLVAIAVPKEDVGEASAILALVRNISGAFGVAIFSTLLDNKINTSVLQISQRSVLRSITSQNMQKFIALIILKAQVAGYAAVFQTAAAVIMLGSLLAFLIKIPREQEAANKQVIITE